MMKGVALVIIAVLGLASQALGQEAAQQSGATKQQGQGERQYPIRDLPADSLRDFPGACFGSTTFRFYQIGDSWPLTPFCGQATCLTDGRHLIERVQDCGLLPKPNPKCKIINQSDIKAPFPKCCPKFKCEEGVELEYPTVEELRQIAEAAAQQQFQQPSAHGIQSQGAAPEIPSAVASKPAQ